MPKALARGSACLLLILFALLSSRVAHAATVANGGFETGDFTGWTTATTCGAAGSWNVYTGTTSPLSASPIDAPPQGTHAAVTDSPLLTASTQILYQDLNLEAGARHVLSFYLYYRDSFGLFLTPPTLSCLFPNNQYRVDLITTTAAVDSVAPGDVLQNLYQTQPLDPAIKAPTLLTFDLSAYAGQTIRLRFAEVSVLSDLLASVDNVQLVSTSTRPAQTQPVFIPLPTGPLGGVSFTGCGSVTVSTATPPTAGTTLSTNGVIPAGEGPGTTLYLTAVPCFGSTFTGWTGGPCNGTATNPCQLTIISGTLPAIAANFSP